MRPGQLTPENRVHRRGHLASLLRFNEAGAINPGKLSGQGFCGNLRSARFNEAGAINPGKPEGRFRADQDGERASMRPGQLTPENLAMRIEVCFGLLQLQ